MFRLTTFGESHGIAVGGVIDGCPAGLRLDFDFIRAEMKRRSPVYPGSTKRAEDDIVEFLSGIEKDITLGTPVAFIIRNAKQQAKDYADLSDVFRPSHADYTYFMKYGHSSAGGGRASGRETAARVAAGAMAKLLLKEHHVEIGAFVSQVGGSLSGAPLSDENLAYAKMSVLACPDKKMETSVAGLIEEAAKDGDTLGGTVSCRIKGVPVGLGEPVFDKLQSDLAKAMLSIGSAKAFEYGLGFQAASMQGSAYNDAMAAGEGKMIFLSNHDGGIQGGISNGEDIYFRVGFKPVPSIGKPQQTVCRTGEEREITIRGRHDACHVPRLVVVVESMAALVFADHLLRGKLSRL
jgi:chorismate synthase